MRRGEHARLPRVVMATALPLMLLAACSRGGSGDTGAVTADEAAQLNDAAAMLDANSIDLDAVDTNAATSNDTDATP